MPDLIESTTAWRGDLFSVQVLRVRDRTGREVTREVVRHPGAVAIVPVLASPDGPPRVVLIRNSRIAVDDRLWEVPAGKLEPGEDPQEAAARELAEETGYHAANLRPLGSFYTSPGFADELMHVFLAEGLEPGPTAHEPGEEIEVEPVAREHVFEMITGGVIRDGKTIAALCLWHWSARG